MVKIGLKMFFSHIFDGLKMFFFAISDGLFFWSPVGRMNVIICNGVEMRVAGI